MLENALTNVPLQVQVTTDDTPPEHADTATSPKGLAVLELSRCDFGGEVSPGLILGFCNGVRPKALPRNKSNWAAGQQHTARCLPHKKTGARRYRHFQGSCNVQAGATGSATYKVLEDLSSLP